MQQKEEDLEQALLRDFRMQEYLEDQVDIIILSLKLLTIKLSQVNYFLPTYSLNIYIYFSVVSNWMFRTFRDKKSENIKRRTKI